MVLSVFEFRLKGKKYSLDVRECKTIFQKMMGLMFRMNSSVLLFVYSKKVQEPIHSFFCRKFIAIWFDGKEIVDFKIVHPWRVSIKSVKKFDKFLEIPLNSEYFDEILDDKENL